MDVIILPEKLQKSLKTLYFKIKISFLCYYGVKKASILVYVNLPQKVLELVKLETLSQSVSTLLIPVYSIKFNSLYKNKFY